MQDSYSGKETFTAAGRLLSKAETIGNPCPVDGACNMQPLVYCGGCASGFCSGDYTLCVNCGLQCQWGGDMMDICGFCDTPDPFGGDIMPPDWRALLHNRCLQDAARNSLVPLGLDTLGLIPVLGGFTKGGKIVKGAGAVAKVARSILRAAGQQFGHFGAVAIQDGRKAFQAVSGPGGLVVDVLGISDGDKVAMAQGALGLATFIPGYGDYAAGLQIGIDLSVTVAKMKACVTR